MMGTWRPLKGLDATEMSRVAEYASFGLIRFRARSTVSIDYDPELLSKRKAELAIEHENERKAQQEALARDPSTVISLNPAPLGRAPWLDNVPTIQSISTDQEIPANHIEQLGAQSLATGRLEVVDRTDNRRRWLYIEIEYCDELETSSPVEEPVDTLPPQTKVGAERGSGRPVGSDQYPGDAALVAEIVSMMPGKKFRQAAKQVAPRAERASENTPDETIIKRLKPKVKRACELAGKKFE